MLRLRRSSGDRVPDFFLVSPADYNNVILAVNQWPVWLHSTLAGGFLHETLGVSASVAAGWGLVLSAIVLLVEEVPRAAFVLAGIGVEIVGACAGDPRAPNPAK